MSHRGLPPYDPPMLKDAVLVSLLLAARLAAGQEPPSAPEPIHLVVVATTDIHGHVEEEEDRVDKPGEGTIRHGGLAVLGGYLANLREAEPGRVVWVDAGDQFQGTLLSNLAEGEPVVKGFDQLGLAAAAVGNHEFDYGPVGPDSVARKPGEDALGALKRNAAIAKYAFLSANMVEKESGKCPSWARPWVLREIAGVKLGIIGLSTPTTPSVTNPLNVKSLLFTDPVKAVLEANAALRAAGADAVIVVAHLGGACREGSGEADLSGCDASSEAFELLSALPTGSIDLLLGGHTHRSVRKVVNGIPMAQAPALGQAFAVADLYVDAAKKRVLTERTVLRAHVPVCAAIYEKGSGCDPRRAPAGPVATVPARFAERPVTRVAAVDKMLAPYTEKVAFIRSQGLGVTLAAPFTRSYEGESELGNLICDALRDSAGADVAIQNNGGIRADLRALSPTYGDLFAVMPFDNFVATARLTPAQLRALLAGNGGDRPTTYQVSGVRVAIDRTVRPPLVTVTDADGKPLDESKRYLVTMSDFLLAGGEGLGKILSPETEPKVRYDEPLQRDAVAAVLKKWGARGKPLEPKKDGRLSIKTR